MKKIFIPVFTLAFGLSADGFAQTLLQDNFDGYVNQAAFQAAWPVVGTQPTGTLDSTRSVSLPNSVTISAGAATATSQRNERSFTESGTPSPLNIVTFSFDYYDSDSALSPYRQYANLQDGAAPASGGLISMGLSNNQTSAGDGGNYYMARILGVDGGTGVSAYFKLNDAAAPLRSTGWHNLAVQISNTDYKFYVDGILSQTIVSAASALNSFDVVRLGAGISSTAVAGYDNVIVSVAPVPEPSTIALGLIGGAGLAFGYIRRRAKK